MILHPDQSSQNMDLSVCQGIMLWFILLQKMFSRFLELLFILQSIKIFVDQNMWLSGEWSKATDLNILSIDQIQKEKIESKTNFIFG